MTAAKASDRISVRLWLAADIQVGPDKEKEAASMDFTAAVAQAESVITGLGITFSGSLEGMPIVFADATPDQIRALAKRAEFMRIDFNDTTGILDGHDG
jgi:hypothetical protein